ncbi:MAG: hypothetical protein PUB69_06895 [Desulfovibrionaceae bacterium]|nr:hypothetical protein [Desulfovibrionaceae bacterium]
MMQAAMDAADDELASSTAIPEETTSQKLLSHLFEASTSCAGTYQSG